VLRAQIAHVSKSHENSRDSPPAVSKQIHSMSILRGSPLINTNDVDHVSSGGACAFNFVRVCFNKISQASMRASASKPSSRDKCSPQGHHAAYRRCHVPTMGIKRDLTRISGHVTFPRSCFRVDLSPTVTYCKHAADCGMCLFRQIVFWFRFMVRRAWGQLKPH